MFNVLVFSSLFIIGAKTIKYLANSANLNTVDKQESAYSTVTGKKDSKNKILAIQIYGPILTESSGDPWENLYSDTTFGYDIKSQIVEATKDNDIKGLLLIVDSPGGTITGSKAISDAVEYYKATTNKPVVTYVAGLSASGAYLGTANSTKILADRGTLIGSIGVIMGPFKKYNQVVAEGDFLGDISTTGGIDTYYLYSGEDKDFGNPYKDMSETAKKAIQQGLDYEYDYFVNHVASSRKIPSDVIKTNIGARAYGVEQAIELGLVDQVATKDQAFTFTAQIASLDLNDYEVVMKHEGSIFDKLFGVLWKNDKPVVTSCDDCERMYYLYGTPDKYFK